MATGRKINLTVIGVATIEPPSARIKTDHPRRNFACAGRVRKDDLMGAR
jgi:hypothetical protein